MLTGEKRVATTGIDAAAVKPAECDIRQAAGLPFETLAIDFEGREHVPESETLRDLASEKDVYLTTPVRADGFDPLGDDSLFESIPDGVTRVLVAGHGAYLSDTESNRAIAPRLKAAREQAPDAWVGTENIERIALATGGPQYELLSRATARSVQAMRAAGFEERIVVYAPTVLSDDEDEILDAVGAYVARRRPVSRALPTGAPTDSSADGRAREVLLDAASDFSLIGTPDDVGQAVTSLKDAGVDTVVGYPARGLEEFLG